LPHGVGGGGLDGGGDGGDGGDGGEGENGGGGRGICGNVDVMSLDGITRVLTLGVLCTVAFRKEEAAVLFGIVLSRLPSARLAASCDSVRIVAFSCTLPALTFTTTWKPGTPALDAIDWRIDSIFAAV